MTLLHILGTSLSYSIEYQATDEYRSRHLQLQGGGDAYSTSRMSQEISKPHLNQSFFPLFPVPASPVQRALKFSAVLGTASACNVMTILPTGSSPISMSRKVRGLSISVSHTTDYLCYRLVSSWHLPSTDYIRVTQLTDSMTHFLREVNIEVTEIEIHPNLGSHF